MTTQPLPDGFASDAFWLAQAIDPNSGLIRLVRMDEAGYRDAGFLDDRLLQSPRETRLCRLDEALAAVVGRRDDARWIFHIGHVGSTLISRLIGEFDSVLAVREPRALRDLAVVDAQAAPAVAAGLRLLMARSFAPEQAALVKATSFVSESAPLLLAPGAAALLLFATPANYIASILAGENSVMELNVLHGVRDARLKSRGIALQGFDRSNAHRAAAAWACEMTTLEAAANVLPDRDILWADFDRMLGDMAGAVQRCLGHFGFAVSRDEIAAVVNGPLMRRYSKALEYDYSPALRTELLAEAARENAANIADALAALRDAAATSALLGRALDRAEREG